MLQSFLHRLTKVTATAALVCGIVLPQAALANASPAPATAPAAPLAQEETEWLVMLYQNADDQVLEGDIFTDLNEAELIGSTDDVVIVSQFDRYDGAFDGDGDWTTTKRYFVTQDDDLAAVNSEELEDLGEVDSGDPQTLTDFVTWAVTNFPAKKYALILSDHGAGWVGGWNDDAPTEGSALSVDEIDQALAAAIAETGIEQFEFIGFDACLMSQVEALTGVAPYARYAVASEEVEPAIGWAYAQFLGGLADKPTQNGATLAKSIVKSYIDDDVRIQDDAARADYVLQVYGTEEEVAPEELAAIESRDVTLTAVDLQVMPAFMEAFNEFAFALTYVDPTAIAKARTYAQSFESVFGEGPPSPYLDLGNFAKLAAQFAESDDLSAAVANLQKASKKFILAEKHGPGKPGATGLTIFFPVPDLLVGGGHLGQRDLLYRLRQPLCRRVAVGRFPGVSLHQPRLRSGPGVPRAADPGGWADGGHQGILDAAVGGGRVRRNAGPQHRSLAHTYRGEQRGDRPGRDRPAWDIDHRRRCRLHLRDGGAAMTRRATATASRTWTSSRRTTPKRWMAWPIPSGRKTTWTDFIFEWAPTVYAISDGETEAFALLEPSVYGASEADSEYEVYGTYTFANGDERSAVMRFSGDLVFKSVYGFSGANGTGAPREITPKPGDTFTISEQWIEMDEDGNEVINEYPGDTLTFGDKPFEVIPYEGYPGDYSLSITVTDLNGNEVTEYANVTVTE